MPLTMYDSIDVTQIPPDAKAAAGYVGGYWPTYPQLVGKFHNVLSVAINASEDAECLDIENGDAVYTDAPAWNARQVARGVPMPCDYTSVDNVPALLTVVDRAAVRIWTAHYTMSAHLCNDTCSPGLPPGFVADATQWTDAALGRNLDESLVSDSFFATVPVPVPAPDPSPPTPTEEITMQATDPASGKLVATDPDGNLYCRPGITPPLAIVTLGEHPEWRAGQSESGGTDPVVGFAFEKDADGSWGYTFVTKPTSGAGSFGPYNLYHVNRDGTF